MSDYKHIKMKERPNPGKKTKVWGVWNKSWDEMIGMIAWDSAWKQYCLEPLDETVWSKGCLRDVADVIEKRMAERKEEKG